MSITGGKTLSPLGGENGLNISIKVDGFGQKSKSIIDIFGNMDCFHLHFFFNWKAPHEMASLHVWVVITF